MSRLIVSNLPSHCTEKRLRSFFEQYGVITDCSLKYTKEGKFRKFAFVGFATDEMCKKAIQTTHQTFLDSSKLSVQECRPMGDESKPRAWSRYSKESSAFIRKNDEDKGRHEWKPQTQPSSSETEGETKSVVDPEFKKFLQAKGVPTAEEQEVVLEVEDTSNTEDLGLDQELRDQLLMGIQGDTSLSLIFGGLPPAIKQKDLKEWLAPIRIKALKLVSNKKQAASFVTFNRPPDVRRALQRDGQFLGGFKLNVKAVKVAEERKSNYKEDRPVVPPEEREKEEEKVRDAILDSGRLFLRNLAYSTKEDDIRVEFKKFGELSDVQVIIDKKTGNCKGFAIVEFIFPESAVAAYAALDGRIFMGRMLHIIAGEEKKEKKLEEGGEGDNKTVGTGTSSYKREQDKKKKTTAGKATHSWNALFLGPNAVADTLAEKLGVSKADLLLSEEGQSAGVRLALAETRLVRETRDYLLANGVSLDAFSRPSAKRSDTVILVKNLASGVEAEVLERMFGKYGDCQKVLIPPEGGVTALIVMGNPVDAKQAFKALAYSRFGSLPLYLEWAPGDVFGEKKKKEGEDGKIEENEEEEKKEEVKPRKRRGEELTEEEKRELGRSKKHRKKEVEEEEKKEEEVEDKEVEQEEEEGAEAMETGEGASKEAQEEEEEIEVEPESTVFVKNLNFDTTDEGLKKFFKKKYNFKFAQISKKLNPNDASKNLSMGFGFVQFYTKAEAEKAIKEMQGSLLDGHCLELKLSHREVKDEKVVQRKGVENVKQGKCTKILVRNLPFQAKIKEIEELFATFGEVKSIRIPRKMGSKDQHRGFGFVDFLSIGEAKRAFEALVHSTHLYGRRLVLEWAKEDDSVDELREKTALKYTGTEKEHKRLRKQMEELEEQIGNIARDDEGDVDEGEL